MQLFNYVISRCDVGKLQLLPTKEVNKKMFLTLSSSFWENT